MITLELSGGPSVALALGKHPALGRPKGSRARYRSVQKMWHDTPDRALALQDLALAEAGPLWVMESLGLGWPRRPGTPATAIASSAHPAELESQLGEILPGPLRPIASLTGRLQRLKVIHEDAVLDLRITTGTLTAIDADGDGAENRPFARAEITGPLDAALSLARALAADVAVTPSLISLPYEAQMLGQVKLKARAAPELAPEMPTEAALGVLLFGVITTFLTRLSQIAPGNGAEPVHQARVALRRLRALMLAFRPILRDAEDALKPPLAALKAVLGPARDWDVFLSETVEPLAGTLEEADTVTDWLRRAATTRRDAAYVALVRFLDSAAYRDLAWRLAGLALGEGWRHADPTLSEDEAGTTIGPFAVKCIESRWKKTARPARDLAALPASEIHDLRIRCKKLRYQAEMFVDVLPSKSGRRLIKRLAEAQETMGLLNDGTVATDLVRSLRPSAAEAAEQSLAAEAIGLIRGHGVGHARDSREAVIASWRKLVKQGPY
jgi:triphosphatase